MGVHSGSRYLLKFWKIIANRPIPETVQDRDVVSMEITCVLSNGNMILNVSLAVETFRMRSSVLSDCYNFILLSLVFFLFLYTGELLVHFVPYCTLPDCCELHCKLTHCICILNCI